MQNAGDVAERTRLQTTHGGARAVRGVGARHPAIAGRKPVRATCIWLSHRLSIAEGGCLGPPRLEAGVATIEPITIPFALGEEEVRDRWIEILGLPEMELVTIVEILSPGNKAGGGRRDYLEKCAGLIDRSVNFVEIDLLLAGKRMPMAMPLPPGDYYAVVGRSTGSPDARSTPGPSATSCRQSRFRCGRPTPMSCSTFVKSST